MQEKRGESMCRIIQMRTIVMGIRSAVTAEWMIPPLVGSSNELAKANFLHEELRGRPLVRLLAAFYPWSASPLDFSSLRADTHKYLSHQGSLSLWRRQGVMGTPE